jgi:hypothetical protein
MKTREMGLECEEEGQVAYCAVAYEEFDAHNNVFLVTEENMKKKKNKLSSWIEEEKLRRVEFRKKSVTEDEFNFCELEKGSFPGEEDDEYVEKRLVKSLMDCR